jgi:hypothetical protein
VVQSRIYKIEQALQAATTVFLFAYVIVQPASIAVTHIFYAAAAVMWLARLVIVRRHGLYSGPLDLPILIYLVLCAISAAYSPLPESSWEGMRKVALVCVVLVFAQNVHTLARAKQLVTVLFVASLVTVVWSLWLYLGGVGLHVGVVAAQSPWYGAGLRTDDTIMRVDGKTLTSSQQFLAYMRTKPAGDPLQLGVVPADGIEVSRNIKPVNVVAAVWDPVETSGQIGIDLVKARPVRAFGFYSHYVTYSMVLALMASLMFGLWLGQRERFSRYGWLCAIAFAALTLVLGMTLTRAAWAALLFAVAVQLWFHYRQKFVRLLLPVAAVLSLLVASAAMYHWRGVTFFDLNDPGTDYRFLMWKDGLRLIRQHPLVGIGMNSVRDDWWLFDLAAYRKYPLRSHFHSTPIQIAVESGIPALLSWILFMALYCRMLMQLIARSRNEQDRWPYGFALGALGATAGLLASSIVHYDFGDTVVIFLFWFMAGIALALRHMLEPAEIP